MKKLIRLLTLVLVIGFSLFLSSCSETTTQEQKNVVHKELDYKLVQDFKDEVVKYQTTTLVLDGDELVVDTNTLKAQNIFDFNYSVTLSQNTFDAQGKYKVTATVKNDDANSIVGTFNFILVVDYPENPEFKEYEDQMFVYFIEGDQSTLNIFMEDYSAFGFEHEDALWYSWEDFSDEDFEHDQNEVRLLREEYNQYKNLKLSYSQINTLKTIDKTITNYEQILSNKEFIMMRLDYVDQFGGNCADFPTTMEAYSLRTKEDIEDIISYFDSIYNSFLSYYDYIVAKEEKGYGISKATLNAFAKYLDGVVKDGEDYYLKNVVLDKIDAAKVKLVLTDDEVNDYKQRFLTAFTEKFLAGHSELSTKVKEYVSEKTSEGYFTNFVEGYLQNYENGATLYEYMLRNRIGMYNRSMEGYIQYLDDSFTKYYNLYVKASGKLTDRANKIANGEVPIISPDTPQDLIEYLKEFAKTIVPDLKTTPTIDVTYMDESLTQNTTTVAYYMKSPIDSRDAEYIHLNAQALGKDRYETIKTLAHEGYPGHLYAYVYSKESDKISNLVTVLTCTGHGEGWAKYVEIALCNYLADQMTSRDWRQAADYSIYYDLFAYSLYARMDVGINYQGWTKNDCASFLTTKGLNSRIASDLYKQLIEIPSQYAPYGYGMLLFYDYHEKAKAELGASYNEIEFNTAILENGWVMLDILEDNLNEFIDNAKFVYGIE